MSTGHAGDDTAALAANCRHFKALFSFSTLYPDRRYSRSNKNATTAEMTKITPVPATQTLTASISLMPSRTDLVQGFQEALGFITPFISGATFIIANVLG